MREINKKVARFVIKFHIKTFKLVFFSCGSLIKQCTCILRRKRFLIYCFIEKIVMSKIKSQLETKILKIYITLKAKTFQEKCARQIVYFFFI